jgi:hypothetical protein
MLLSEFRSQYRHNRPGHFSLLFTTVGHCNLAATEIPYVLRDGSLVR